MRLFAAIVPPREVLDEVRRVVQSVNDPLPPEPQGRGLMRRLSGRSSHGGAHAAGRTVTPTKPQPTNAASTHELAAVEPARMYLPLTGFGNVTLGDSVKLISVLRAEAATWPRPSLTFAGGAALEFPGDESVWVKIDGDVEALKTIGRGVPQAVQRVGYFVDRRQFRPWLSVGTITDTTSAPYLERLVAALDEFRGDWWTAEAVSVMKWLPESGREEYEEMERLPLA
jgi:RNA 2',3'-cyclic 3'-phosphodiesterase